jgi:glutathione S-transferase
MTLILRYSGSSPYARKVRVVAHECGLARRIEEIPSNPWAAPEDLKALNPLGKIPTLVTEDGFALYDSAVISEYLDTLHDGPRLFPAEGAARWQALRTQALGDGIMDAAILWRVEITQRKEQGPTPGWVERQKGAILRSLDMLERDETALAGPLTVGPIAIACALGYLDYRFGFLNWRDGRPRLAAWYAAFAERPAMVATAPKDAV